MVAARSTTNERTNPSQGALLRRWFEDRVLPTFAGRVLSFDLAAARILAAYRVPGHAPYADAVTGAVAASADKVVVTRNIGHLQHLGVRYLNPWDR